METLKKLREAFHVSQSELARRTGLSASLISHFENHRRTPNQDQYDAMLNAIIPMDTPIKEVRQAQALLDIFEFSPREMMYVYFSLKTVQAEDYSQSLDRGEAARLLEFLMMGKALRRQSTQLEKKLNDYDMRVVYNARGLRSAINTERHIMDDGQEITIPIIGRINPDPEKNREQEMQWADCQIKLTYRAKCIECLMQDQNYKHFVLDYVQGMKEEDLKRRYHIENPREKMIELIMTYVKVNRYAYGDAG